MGSDGNGSAHGWAPTVLFDAGVVGVPMDGAYSYLVHHAG
jgi:hypothetical protein